MEYRYGSHTIYKIESHFVRGQGDISVQRLEK